MSQETVTKISAFNKVLIFNPALTRHQQSAIAASGAYDLVPATIDRDTLDTSAFYCERIKTLTVAGRVVAALRASGFEAEIRNPGVPGEREEFTSLAEAEAYL
jgi:hypothetical protein